MTVIALSPLLRSSTHANTRSHLQPRRVKLDFTVDLNDEEFVAVACAAPAAPPPPRRAAVLSLPKGLAVEAWIRLRELVAAANLSEAGEQWLRLVAFFTGLRIHWNNAVRVQLERLAEQYAGLFTSRLFVQSLTCLFFPFQETKEFAHNSRKIW
jgi:hypothetical protein